MHVTPGRSAVSPSEPNVTLGQLTYTGCEEPSGFRRPQMVRQSEETQGTQHLLGWFDCHPVKLLADLAPHLATV